MEWSKGDILKSNHVEAIHPIIFLEGYNDSYFIGAMISTKGPDLYPDSIPMEEIHFNEYNESGGEYETKFGPSFLVDALLLKEHIWKPFHKTGQLTPEGINFVESQVKDKFPLVWNDYRRNRPRPRRVRD